MRASPALLFVVVALVASVSLARAQTTLEIPQRIATPAPEPQEAATPEQETNQSSLDEGIGATPDAASARPYLGASIQYIQADDFPGREVRGLEVVAVDPNSPAERAGLRGRGHLTKLGATGATTGALMPPLDLIIMPLLKKAGELGDDGDLIIAIDDNRVNSADDLQTALESAKPGETIYFTIVRQHQDARPETIKVPVKLAAGASSHGPVGSK